MRAPIFGLFGLVWLPRHSAFPVVSFGGAQQLHGKNARNNAEARSTSTITFGIVSNKGQTRKPADDSASTFPLRSSANVDAEGEEMFHEAAEEGRIVKLTAALQTFQSKDAQDLLEEWQRVRDESITPAVAVMTTTSSNDNNDGSTTAVVAVDEGSLFLDELLERGPDRPLPFWATSPLWRRPLARFSQRARLASLRRVLELITPPPSSSDDNEIESAEDTLRRRRRALLLVLRTLSQDDPAAETGASSEPSSRRRRQPPAIRQLEIRAAREQQQRSGGLDDLLARRPAGLETPRYTVVDDQPATSKSRRRGGGGYYEIRRYEPYSVATVSMEKLQQRDVDPQMDAAVREPAKGGFRAFGALAGYLFGKNQAATAMKMTTPVFSTDYNNEPNNNNKRMSFVLPSTYWNETATAPQPLPGSGVELQRVDGEERAVLAFGGYVTSRSTREKEAWLRERLAKDPVWEMIGEDRDDSLFQLAQYNDPFTPPWKRLNEVSVPVRRRRSHDGKSASSSVLPRCSAALDWSYRRDDDRSPT